MGRTATKTFLGNVVTEVRLGPMRTPLARAARAERLPVSDLIRREIARFLAGRGVNVDPRLTDPAPLKTRRPPTAPSSVKRMP